MIARQIILVGAVLTAIGAKAADPVTLYTVPSPPWGGLTNDPNGPGVFDDWAAEVSRRTGLTFDIKRVPSVRALEGLKDKTIDIAFGIKGVGLEGIVDFPICPVSSSVLIIASKNFPMTKIEDLYTAPQGVGVTRGIKYEKSFDENTQIKKSEEPDLDTILRKMSAGRLQAIIGSGFSLFYQAKMSGMRDILGDRLTIGRIDACLRTPAGKSDTPTVRAMVKALDAMKADGTAAAIVTKYVGEGWQ